MESIGEKLRQAREARKITIRDVVKETNISPAYLQALEEEKFDKFPSETYLVGFLRWAVRDGQKYAAPLLYAPLPKQVASMNESSIKSITNAGK